MFYLLNLLIVILYYYLLKIPYRDELQHKKMFAIIVGIHAVLFRALANPFNYVDTEGYSSAFYNIYVMSFKEAVLSINYYSSWGQGYMALNWLVGQFTDEFQWLYAVLSVLSVAPVIWFHYKMSHHMLLSLAIYFTYPMMYYMGFGVLRQHLAAGVVLLALYYVNDWKKSLPLAVIATLCHTSAVVFFPFYLFRYFCAGKKEMGRIMILLFLGVLVCSFVFMYFVEYFSRYEEGHIGNGDRGDTLPLIVLGTVSLLYFFTGANRKVIEAHEKDCSYFIFYGVLLSIEGLLNAGLGRMTIYNFYVMPIFLSLIVRYGIGSRRIVPWVYIVSLFCLIAYLHSIDKINSFIYGIFWI